MWEAGATGSQSSQDGDAFLQPHRKAPQSGGSGVRAEFPLALSQLGIAGAICSSLSCICNAAATELLRAASTSPCGCLSWPNEVGSGRGGAEHKTYTPGSLSLTKDANQPCRHQEDPSSDRSRFPDAGRGTGTAGGMRSPITSIILPFS